MFQAQKHGITTLEWFWFGVSVNPKVLEIIRAWNARTVMDTESFISFCRLGNTIGTPHRENRINTWNFVIKNILLILGYGTGKDRAYTCNKKRVNLWPNVCLFYLLIMDLILTTSTLEQRWGLRWNEFVRRCLFNFVYIRFLFDLQM